MNRIFIPLAALALVANLSQARASGEAPDSLAAETRITLEAAASAARARVPGGRVVSAELEREHGTLVWSFDISTSTSKNITEVQIDAGTGMVVAEETETPLDQANEEHANPAH